MSFFLNAHIQNSLPTFNFGLVYEICYSLSRGESNLELLLHFVSAFATSLRLVLGQEKVSDKSNEITAIPELLKLLEIKGAIVTIDAMGCQKEIVKQICEKEADYVLSLKGNQGTLHEDVKFFLESEVAKESSEKIEFYEEIEKEHGRIEIRRYYVSDKIQWLTQKKDWQALRSVAMVESIREIKGERTLERRFYISSLPPPPHLGTDCPCNSCALGC